jgi:UDP-glucose 4-epimerase
MRVLVSGGAGYIGSHTVVQLVAAGHEVAVADSFVNAKPAVMGRLEALTGCELPLYAVDLTDHDKTEAIFAAQQFDAVVHFAGLKAVGESVAKPLEYYENNLVSTFALLRAMRRHGCRFLVFSSSATVYGTEAPVPYREDYEPLVATSPYGRTKVMIEHVLRDIAAIDEPAAGRDPALLQPGRGTRLGHHRRGPARHPEQPHALRRPGGGRSPGAAAGLRR